MEGLKCSRRIFELRRNGNRCVEDGEKVCEGPICKGCPINLSAPKLENWRMLGGMLIGEVYEDIRFADGSPVRTSIVKELNESEGYAITKNTIYTLGKKQVIE